MNFPSTLPASRVPDPMDAPPLRWGILGTGWIAQKFTSALGRHTRQQVYAVGSRSLDGAHAFSDRYVEDAKAVGTASYPEPAQPVAYGSYEELVTNPDVDVVYVATPHNLHLPHGLLSIEAGKPTVVEKPMGLDAGEVATLETAAAEHGVFLMEALWSAYLPKFDVIRQLFDDGVLGTVHSVQADIGEYFGPQHRIMRADLAGGARHDLLTYPRWLATWLLGEPAESLEVTSPAPYDLSPSGVEGSISVAMRWESGTVASLFATVLGDTPTTATVVGSAATLHLDAPFYQPGGFTLRSHDGQSLRYDEPAIAHEGLYFEATAAARRWPPYPRPVLDPLHSLDRHAKPPLPKGHPTPMTHTAAKTNPEAKARNDEARYSKLTIGVCPDQWGVWFPEDEKQIPWHTALDEMAAAGFSVMETGPFGYFPKDPKALQEEMDKRGFRVVAGTGWGILHKPEAWADTEATFRAIGETHAAVGAEYVVHLPPMFRDEKTWEYTDDRVLSTEAWNTYISNADRLGRIMKEDYGLKMVLHPHGDSHIETPEDIDRVFQATDPDYVGFCLDTGHIVYGGGDPVELCRKYPERISYVHIKAMDQGLVKQAHDEDWPFGLAVAKGCSVAPPAGAPEMSPFIEALADLDKELYVVCEQDMYPCDPSVPLPTAIQTREYLASVGLGQL